MNRGRAILKTQLNRLKDGRGQGYGKDYEPFIQASDNKAPSEGYLIRELGWKTGRIHHILSKEECRYLMVLTWPDTVVDIREQYPLTPIERSIEIAEQLNIKHAHLDGEPVHATTDVMITIETEKGLKDVVRTVKPPDKLTPRTLELF
ncbi:TnsA endonuclease N-terminal domain-containing protein [Paenibacillus pectinilyticus]|nr:TnsA endonuclease N-terminal domain-containing protein [Paenibacillus pectinilyticus]